MDDLLQLFTQCIHTLILPENYPDDINIKRKGVLLSVAHPIQ